MLEHKSWIKQEAEQLSWPFQKILIASCPRWLCHKCIISNFCRSIEHIEQENRFHHISSSTKDKEEGETKTLPDTCELSSPPLPLEFTRVVKRTKKIKWARRVTAIASTKFFAFSQQSQMIRISTSFNRSRKQKCVWGAGRAWSQKEGSRGVRANNVAILSRNQLNSGRGKATAALLTQSWNVNPKSVPVASFRTTTNETREREKRATSGERERERARAVASEQSKQALVFALCAVVVAL